MTQATQLPAAVYVIWWIGVIVAGLVLVPLAAFLLHRTWQAAHSIRLYAEEALEAAAGIAASTADLSPLRTTIDAGGDLHRAAGEAASSLERLAAVLEQRRSR